MHESMSHVMPYCKITAVIVLVLNVLELKPTINVNKFNVFALIFVI